MTNAGGTTSTELLDERPTVAPPSGAGAESVTTQFVLPPPMNVEGEHVSNDGVAGGCSVRVNVLVISPAVAEIVAVPLAVTAPAVAVNAALVKPAATVTDAGTVTLGWLLVRATGNPLLGAAAVRLTTQEVVPGVAKDAG